MGMNLKLGLSLGGGTLNTGGGDLYPGSLFAIDWQHGFFSSAGVRKASAAQVTGYTAVGAQNITAEGLLCNSSGYGYIASPGLPVGDWTLLIQTKTSGAADFARMFGLNDNTVNNELQIYGFSSNAAANILLKVATAGIFETTAYVGGPLSPVRLVITKNGTAVRSSVNGQSPVAIGTWSAFTPTRLMLGCHGPTSGPLDYLNDRLSIAALFNAGKTDPQLQTLSTVVA